jgi:hypothetical protein
VGQEAIGREIRAGPTDWVGIDPKGNVITNEAGSAASGGHWRDYLPHKK